MRRIASFAQRLSRVVKANDESFRTRMDRRRAGRSRDRPEPEVGVAGTVVDVVAIDMGQRGMMGRSGGWMGGTMSLRSDRVDVRAGTVTLQRYNSGAVQHELVVLTLPDGQQVGDRSVGRDTVVVESDSLGEASQTGGPGPGEGIDPGTTTGWVTIDLTPSRYEIACNIENHYAAGMYTLLVVT